MCARIRGRTNTLQERPGSAAFYLRSTISTGLLCLLVGACVHYLSSCCLHLQKRITKGRDLPPHGVAPITIIGVPGWAPAEMT